ncbi:MAG: BF2992 family fimbrillin-A clan protein [Bacteroidales bacterium]|nr:BF2992 family fimbrillin-A clan protein [Bacteroidales bacterium]MBR1578866.1 BF2992 family fimbrillin-A clan protein [Bacteroidales bacterium]
MNLTMHTTTQVIPAACLALALLAAGCAKSPVQPGARTQILIDPGVYGAFAAPATKAVDLSRTGDPAYTNYYYNGFTGEPAKVSLPVGSTVWLTYRQGTYNGSGSTADPANFSWGPIDLHAYVVQDAAGFHALYPVSSVEVTEDGVTYLDVVQPIVYAEPLYLEDGYYQFRMVSPANRIKKSNLAMQMDNGMYVYANDERYTQTASKVLRIQSHQEPVQNILLNPVIAQMARFKVTIHPGANVSTMEMLPQGIEISGLQNPEMDGEGHLEFKWSSMDIRDTLVMKRGDKYARVSIREFTTDPATGAITGDVGVLPTNAYSTVSYILINMAVNGIPTQYVLSLNGMKFFHGHSYDLDLSVDLDGDIHVMSWSNQGWTGEVSFN